MRTDWKALCAELANTLERAQKALRFEGGCSDATDSKRRALILRARAALAQPESEVVGPTDEELLGVAAQTIEPYDEIRLDEYEPENNCAIEVYGSELIAFARAVLGRWGRPAPAPAGEVAELVEFLRIYGDEVMDEYGDVGEHDQLTRAADLLERLVVAEESSVAASVPVGEVRYAKDVRRMCEIILGNTFGNEELDSLALLVGHHPDVLNASPVPIEEVRELVAWLRETGDLIQPNHLAEHQRYKRAAALLEMQEGLIAQAYQDGRRDGQADEQQASKSTEGEVGELAKWLRLRNPIDDEGFPDDCAYFNFTRAADLLEQQATAYAICERERLHRSTRAADLEIERHPTPVPVSERPWEREGWCDDEDRCWCMSSLDGPPPRWWLVRPEPLSDGWVLPATALPLPQGEVQP